MTDKAKLVEQFKNLGIKEGMTLLVHSSLRRVGKVDGGADTVIDALLEVLGENGTLLMSGVSAGVVSQAFQRGAQSAPRPLCRRLRPPRQIHY